MADEYPIEDKAELMAESLGIAPSSYAGRTSDAIVAMTLVAGYPRMTYNDKRQVLSTIRDKMDFGKTNTLFFIQCQGAIGLMVANPVWVPGSLTNEELESEIIFWRDIRWLLGAIGAKGAKDFLSDKGKGVLDDIGNELEKGAPGQGADALREPIMKALKPGRLAGPVLFGTAAFTIAEDSLDVLQAEAKRRGRLGTMTKLHSERYGG